MSIIRCFVCDKLGSSDLPGWTSFDFGRVNFCSGRCENKFLKKENQEMYEIKITQMVLKEVPAGEDWEIIDKRPHNKEEVDKMDEMYKNSLGELALKEVYGYTPKLIKEEHVEVEILKQTVGNLDLTAVIKAINGIK